MNEDLAAAVGWSEELLDIGFELPVALSVTNPRPEASFSGVELLGKVAPEARSLLVAPPACVPLSASKVVNGVAAPAPMDWHGQNPTRTQAICGKNARFMEGMFGDRNSAQEIRAMQDDPRAFLRPSPKAGMRGHAHRT